MKFGSGLNVTSPVPGLIVYVPSPGTSTEVSSVGSPVSGSISLAGTVGSIGVFSCPSVNVGVPLCS